MALSDSSSLNGKLKILTFGAGAIGTYIGGSLALAGHQVVFVEQQKVVDELRERGLRLDLTLDERRKTKEASTLASSAFVIVASLEEALRYGPFDLALFALKSFDTQAALEAGADIVHHLAVHLSVGGLAEEFGGAAMDHYNRRLEKSIGQFDVTHNFKLGAVYDLPPRPARDRHVALVTAPFWRARRTFRPRSSRRAKSC